jgi:O-antigen/teichoic acid export membrane protein
MATDVSAVEVEETASPSLHLVAVDELATVGDSVWTGQEADGAAAAAPENESSPAGRRVARNLSVLIGGQAVTWTMTLVWTLIVPRALGPVGLGILVSAQSVAGVLGIVLGMGTRNYLVRETVINPGDGPRLVGTAFILRIAVAPLVGLAAVLWARVAGYGHEASTVLYLITAMTVLTLLTEPLQAAFQAIERMKYLAYADIVNKTAQSLIGIALVVMGFKVVGIAANMAVIAGVVFLITFWWLRPHFRVDLKTNWARMAHMTKQSIAYWAFGLFGMIYFWIDTIMLSLMTRPEVVGWYGATTNLFQTLMFLPVIVQTAWLPRLVSAFVQSRRNLVETARAPVELILMVSMPIAVGTAIVADPLIHAVYGPAFAHAVPVMILLAVCIPPIYLNIILASVLLAAKRQKAWTVVMAGAAVVNPLFNLVLIPMTEHRYHNGAIGAGISLVLTEVLMDGIGLVLIGRHVFNRRVLRRWAAACQASVGMGAAAYLTRPLGTPASVAAGFVTLGVLLFLLRIVGRKELALVRSAVVGRLRRPVPEGAG